MKKTISSYTISSQTHMYTHKLNIKGRQRGKDTLSLIEQQDSQLTSYER